MGKDMLKIIVTTPVMAELEDDFVSTMTGTDKQAGTLPVGGEYFNPVDHQLDDSLYVDAEKRDFCIPGVWQ